MLAFIMSGVLSAYFLMFDTLEIIYLFIDFATIHLFLLVV